MQQAQLEGDNDRYERWSSRCPQPFLLLHGWHRNMARRLRVSGYLVERLAQSRSRAPKFPSRHGHALYSALPGETRLDSTIEARPDEGTFGVAENTVRLSPESASGQFPTFCRGLSNIRPRLPMEVWRQPTTCHCSALPGPQPMKSQKTVSSSPGYWPASGPRQRREPTVSDRADDRVIPRPARGT